MESGEGCDEYIILTFSKSNKASLQSAAFVETPGDNNKSPHEANILMNAVYSSTTNDDHYGEAIFVDEGTHEEFSIPSSTEYIASQGEHLDVNNIIDKSSFINTSSTNLCSSSNNSKSISYNDESSRNKKMLKCYACGKYYRHEYGLRHHICLPRKHVWRKGDIPSEIINGLSTYYCPTCAKPFRWLGNLTRHFYVHTGQRFFKCEICDKEFFSAYQVRRHMNSHTGQRFKCELCGKPFTCKYACSWHTRQHYAYAE